MLIAADLPLLPLRPPARTEPDLLSRGDGSSPFFSRQRPIEPPPRRQRARSPIGGESIRYSIRYYPTKLGKLALRSGLRFARAGDFFPLCLPLLRLRAAAVVVGTEGVE